MSTKRMSFWDWFDKVTADKKTTPVGQAMVAAGFDIVHTGGGCLAWERKIENGYIWVCDEGNGLGDTLDEAYLLGIYVGEDADECVNDEINGITGAIRWCLEAETALRICRKWVKKIGGGFHPDTRGASYTPALSVDEVKEYDADIEKLFLAPGDPYKYAVLAMQEVQQ